MPAFSLGYRADSEAFLVTAEASTGERVLIKVIALADAAEENQAKMFQAFTKLRSATHLMVALISLWQKLSADQVAILEATFLPLAEDTPELGWEEAVDAAISYLLRTCLSKSSKEQALNLSSQLCMPKDTSRLKKNITLFCDRLAKGGRLSFSTDSAAQQPAVVPDFGIYQVDYNSAFYNRDSVIQIMKG
ncbi:protein hypothetical protein [Limosa lapponica baueri]|uniref:Uncharacterized protein n=1 Tax=Limosa lapponica baueri TaxID=1758121 RepID=A0A2I0UDH4_LIMLA|nr:protein hypothetical protein [Limosa lapponica baueri]